MTYRKPHVNCAEHDCQSYSAYIRVKKRWIKAGEYNSKCRSFTPNDNVKTYDQIRDDERQKMLEGNPHLRKLLEQYRRHKLD